MVSFNPDINKAEKIWNTLICLFPNPYGVAGIMGNLFAESSLNPSCCTGGGLKTKEAKAEYIQKAKDGAISRDGFAHDGVAFGLAQWRFWSRKEAFYDFCKENFYAIDDQMGQLNYLWRDIGKNYKKLNETLQNATSVREASDAFMERYEKPGDMSEAAKEKRANYGNNYYNLFSEAPAPDTDELYVSTTAPRVNLRIGNGQEYSVVKRALVKGTKYKWVATAKNGWHAVIVPDGDGKTTAKVLWISPDFSEIQSG